MPVSLERLIAEIEPNVITEQLTRECIQVRFRPPPPFGSVCPAERRAQQALNSRHACVQIPGSDPDTVEDKKRNIPFRKVECLAFSFKSIAKIDNLKGLEGLTKLQLDNNSITKIEKLSHLVSAIAACRGQRARPPPSRPAAWRTQLQAFRPSSACVGWGGVGCSFKHLSARRCGPSASTVLPMWRSCAQTNLTWLDLSFNKITKIEGLEALTKLVDLSLFNNQIAEIENLEKLTELNVLSLGEGAWLAEGGGRGNCGDCMDEASDLGSACSCSVRLLVSMWAAGPHPLSTPWVAGGRLWRPLARLEHRRACVLDTCVLRRQQPAQAVGQRHVPAPVPQPPAGEPGGQPLLQGARLPVLRAEPHQGPDLPRLQEGGAHGRAAGHGAAPGALGGGAW